MKVARDALAPLRRRDFSLLMGSQWLAQAADGLVGVSLAKNIVFGGQRGFSLEEARTPEDIARIVLLTVLPYAFFSPLLGVFIDRWDRRRLLIGASAVRAAFLTLVVVVGLATIGDAALYGSFLLILVSTRLMLAIKGAALPAVLGERGLLQGNSISQAGGAIFQLAGAGVGIAASGLLSTRVVIVGGVVGYALATAAAAGIGRLGYAERVVPLSQEIGRVLRDLADGVREVARRPVAGLSLVAFLALRALVTFSVLAVALASREFFVEEGTLSSSIPAGAGALGAAVGFVAAQALKQRASPARLAVAAMAVPGVGLIAFGGAITLGSLSLVAFAVGLGFFLGKISLDTLLQEALQDAYRGRAFGLQDLAYNLSWIVPALVLWAAWSDGRVRALLVGTGVLFLATAVAVGVGARRIPAPAPAAPAPQPSAE